MAEAAAEERRAAHLPEQPGQGLGARRAGGGQELAELLGEIDEDRAGFEHADRLGAAAVDQRRDLRIGIDRDEAAARTGRPRRCGSARRHIRRPLWPLLEQLLEHDRDLLAVRASRANRAGRGACRPAAPCRGSAPAIGPVDVGELAAAGLRPRSRPWEECSRRCRSCAVPSSIRDVELGTRAPLSSVTAMCLAGAHREEAGQRAVPVAARCPRRPASVRARRSAPARARLAAASARRCALGALSALAAAAFGSARLALRGLRLGSSPAPGFARGLAAGARILWPVSFSIAATASRVLARRERDGDARHAGAAGAADAVDVIVGLPRHVEVDDVADAFDVEPARGDVGGDEDVDLAVLKRSNSAMRLGLVHVALDLADREARALEAGGELAHRGLAVGRRRSRS